MLLSQKKAEPARIIGVKPQSINTATTRDKIPDRWFDLIEKKFGVTRGGAVQAAGTGRGHIGAAPYGATDDEERQHCLRELNSIFQIITNGRKMRMVWIH